MREQIKQAQSSAGPRTGEDVRGFTAGQEGEEGGVVCGIGTPG